MKVTFIDGFAFLRATRKLRMPEDPERSIHKGESILQRLFSAFPDGWPGLGLLLLRGLVGFTLVAQSIGHIKSTNPGLLSWFVAALALSSAGCLLLGFMTPIVAVVIGVGAISFAFSDLSLPIRYFFGTNQTLVDVIVLAAAILLLGPGAFSLDARMFGRREIRIPAPSNSTTK